jgi:hypothetical protein
MDKNKIKQIFEILCKYYWIDIQKKESPQDHLKDWLGAFKYFTRYAYERSVKVQQYIDSSIKVLKANKEDLNDLFLCTEFNKELEEKINLDYKNDIESHNNKYNPKVDIMRCSEKNKKSILRFLYDINKDDNTKNIAEYVINHLKNGDVKTPYNTLTSIWGIGDKIATFYLRDCFLSLLENPSKILFKNPDEDKLHFQPLDTWVLSALEIIVKMRPMDKKKMSKGTFYKKVLLEFEKELELLSGQANIALWVLGAKISPSKVVFQKIIQEFLNGDYKELKQIAGVYNNISTILSEQI